MERYSELLVVKVEPGMSRELRRLARQEERSISSTTRRLLAAALASRRALASGRPAEQ